MRETVLYTHLQIKANSNLKDTALAPKHSYPDGVLVESKKAISSFLAYHLL